MGHRGAALSAPENTLAGFRRAAAVGAPWVEFDVNLTADGACVVHHDETLLRTTGADARVDASSLAMISSLDAGAGFGAAFAGEAPPSLTRALALIAELRLGANIGFKTCPKGREGELAIAVGAAVASAWPADRSDIMVSSFDDPLLVAARRHLPDLPRGMIAGRQPRSWLARARRLGCAAPHLHHEAVTPARAKRITGHGFGLAVWSVDDPARARALWGLGVDCVISRPPEGVVVAWRRK